MTIEDRHPQNKRQIQIKNRYKTRKKLQKKGMKKKH